MSIKNGGPAFPTLDGRDGPHDPEYFSHDGMTLRDWFAGQALAAVDQESLYYGTIGNPQNPWPNVASDCYRAADAMLTEREKVKELTQ